MNYCVENVDNFVIIAFFSCNKFCIELIVVIRDCVMMIVINIEELVVSSK